MEDVKKYCMCIGNTARERKNGILYDEKRGRNLTVRTF